MKKLNVELKKVQTFQGHDGTGLNADIWVNGTKCLHVYDAAYGGCFEYYDYTHNAKNPNKVKALILELNNHIESLPETEYTFGSRTTKLKMDRDLLVSQLLEEKEMNKLYRNSIIIGVPDNAKYTQFKFKRPLKDIPVNLLQGYVRKYQMEHCTDGKIIMNTNLKELGIEV